MGAHVRYASALKSPVLERDVRLQHGKRCVASGHIIVTPHEPKSQNATLLTLCRRIISHQIKERRRRRRSRPRRKSKLTHGPPAYLRSTPSIRELVTALISS